MNDIQNRLPTPVVDLYTPVSRLTSATRVYGRLHRWWLLLRRYWWLLGLILVVVLGPALCYIAVLSPTYVSKARLWVTGKINVAESWSYTEELVNFLGTQAALLRSPAIQRQAMAKLQAEFKPGPQPAQNRGWGPVELLREVKALWRDLFPPSAVVETNVPPPIPFDVKVAEGSKSSTLELQVTGSTPMSTRRFLDCLMEAYLTFKKEASDKTSEQAAGSLNAGAAQLRDELAAAQRELQAFQASNNVVFLQQQGSSAESYLAELNRQLAASRTELSLLDSLKPEQWAQIASQSALGAGARAGNEGVARQLQNNLSEAQTALFQADQKMHLLQAEREELARFLRPAHPKILKLNQDIAAQEELVKVSREAAATQLTVRREALVLQIRNLEAACKEWNVQAIDASRKMAQYGEIQQKAQRLQAAYDKTLGLLQNLDVNKRIEQANIGILEPASVAKPTQRQFLYLAAAIVFALLLCFAALYGLGLFADDFASHTELTEALAFPVVAQIPSTSVRRLKPPLRIEALERQRFDFLEAFRNLRASLLFLNQNGTLPKAVLITSAVPGEGKSTVSLFLATTLASAKARVLLIDADLRRPSLHQRFGLPLGPGLADLLEDEALADDFILPTSVEHLALLPAGEAKRNPGELVVSPAWTQLLMAAKKQFDYIIVDAPPVTATADAATLAPKSDGVLFVVRALSTSARVTSSALDVLRQRGAQVIGLILNRAVTSPYEHSYYQPYAGTYRWEPTLKGRNGAHGRSARDYAQPADAVEKFNQVLDGD